MLLDSAVYKNRENGLAKRAQAHRLMGDVIGICPPLIISEDEIDVLFDRLGRALDDTLERLRPEPR